MPSPGAGTVAGCQPAHQVSAGIQEVGWDMRLAAVLVFVWLLIGLVAAVQRDYPSDVETNCAEVGGHGHDNRCGPLNYFGVNPKIECDLPQPSR